MRAVLAMLTAVCLVGCAQQPKQVWIRTDGQRLAASPVLNQKFEVDKIACEGNTEAANMAGTQFCRGAIDCAVAAGVRQQQMLSVAKGCMADRGYLLVNEDVADAKIAELEAINKQAQAPQQKQAKR